MDVSGLGLGVVAEARTLTQSIITRIDNYGQGPDKFRKLVQDLNNLTEHITDINTSLAEMPHALPASFKGIFNRTFSLVKENLQTSREIVYDDFSRAFRSPSSGFLSKMRCKVYRITRAKSLSTKMDSVSSKITDACTQLLQLAPMLSNAVKFEQHQRVLLPCADKLCIAESKEDYQPEISTKLVSHTVSLDFESNATPEGELKFKVLSSISSDIIPLAGGYHSSVFALVGMAGVGKTIALQGLSVDKDILACFPDGVHYLSLGQDASPRSVIDEIAHIMQLTGATTSVQRVTSTISLRQAVDNACKWFRGKKCVFLIDDVWPTEDCPAGFLTDLRQLLRGSPESRMVASTRSVSIAFQAEVVECRAREPLGALSVNMFMKYTRCSDILRLAPEAGDSLLPSMAKILSWCGGLPIALAVTGSAVAMLVRNAGRLERACEIYVSDFESRGTNLGEEISPDNTRLSDLIQQSLKYLHREFSKWKKQQTVVIDNTISDLYTSLCVLTKQAWVPVSALGGMWKIDEKLAADVVDRFCGLSLATLSFRKDGNDGKEKAEITLHDLHLEFCKKQSESTSSERRWHSLLLNGYLDQSSDLTSFDLRTLSSQQLLGLTPRPWWSVSEDGYIHANLARHLSLSGRGAELSALLMDARWVNVQGQLGGIVGLKADYDVLDQLLEKIPSNEAQSSFRLILKAIQLSWASFCYGPRAFHFQICGRLLSVSNRDAIVNSFVKSMEAHTPRPYLKAMTPFFPELNSSQILEFPVGGWCYHVECAPCGRYMAAGGGHDIVIADLHTGEVLKRLKGHRDNVRCIRFAAGSKKIVSSSDDRTVAVWEWEESDSPIRVLEGHTGCVRTVAVSSDGNRIYSGSMDETLRIWNGKNGSQTEMFAMNSGVNCVDTSSDDKKLALGLGNGTVKVLDSCGGETLFENTDAHEVLSVSFSPDGQLLATGSTDKHLRIWHTGTWDAIESHVEKHTLGMKRAVFSSDGLRLVSASSDRTIRLWDVLPAKAFENVLKYPILREKAALFAGSVDGLTLTCDGERIMSGSFSGIVRVWDASLGLMKENRCFGHDAQVFGVSISQDGEEVASAGSDKAVRLWDTRTGAQIGKSLEGHSDRARCVSFSPDRRQLVSGSADRTLRLWDTEKLCQIGNPLEGHTGSVLSVSFSSDGLRIVSGSADRTVRVWNRRTRAQLGDPLIGHTKCVTCVAETSDGRFVVSRDDSPETIIWNSERRAMVWRSNDPDRNVAMSNTDAERIVRSCGYASPLLWPHSFPKHAPSLFCEQNKLYSSVLGENIVLGILPSHVHDRKYSETAKVFAAALDTGGVVAICRLIEDLQ